MQQKSSFLDPGFPCTALILTHNCCDTISARLESLRSFGEVIVQDGYSTDGTRDLVQRYANIRLVNQNSAYLDSTGKIIDFSAIRNEGIALASFEWVFIIDSDEDVDVAFIKEIQGIVQCNIPGVYQAFRRYYLRGSRIDWCARYPSYQIRLFHRSLVFGYIKSIHERLQLRDGAETSILQSELAVPLDTQSAMHPKIRRYIQMEVRRCGVTSLRSWFRWVLYRNLRSMLGILLRLLWIWLRPRHGVRMPLAYELQYFRYSWGVIVATFPPVAQRMLAKERRHPMTSAI